MSQSSSEVAETLAVAINVSYGELREGIHITGYTFERACGKLLWLLREDRWKQCGKGFKEINSFLDGIRIEDFKLVAEQRKKIAAAIKALQPTVSNRALAKTLGVGRRTIDRDSGPNDPTRTGKTNKNKEGGGPFGPPRDAPPESLSGPCSARLGFSRATAAEDRRAKVIADEERILQLAPRPGKFRTIVMDPAWEYDWLSIAGRAKPGYAMQTHKQLLALDVKQWTDTEAGCHLYLWTTNNFMARACELTTHWGFQHRVVLTWIKPPPFGLGSYFRNSTEHVIFATLGETTTRPSAASIPTHFEAPRGEHSEKPECFYEIVRLASYPPYGEANQRKEREDFVSLYCPVIEQAEATSE